MHVMGNVQQSRIDQEHRIKEQQSMLSAAGKLHSLQQMLIEHHLQAR